MRLPENNNSPKCWLMGLGITLSAIYLLSCHIALMVNVSSSLPHTIFIVIKGQPVQKGDYVAFYPPTNPLYGHDKPFIKRIGGVPGDHITESKDVFYINGKEIGRALSHSSKGIPLTKNRTGTLKSGEYFVYAPHPRSFDSRYGEMGFISQINFIGHAYPLF